MNKSQVGAKKRRRQEREEFMALDKPFVTRMLLASYQAIERHEERKERRYLRDSAIVPNESAQGDSPEAEPLPFEPTPEELQAAYAYELTNDDQEILNRVTTQLKKAVSEE